MPKCPKDCKKPNPFIFRRVVIPAIVDDDTINPPANGAYCNAVVVYEATGNVYLYSSDGIPTSLSSTDYNLLSNLPSINGKVLRGDVTLSDLGISQLIEEEARIRATADGILQRQIDAITVASDVVDIVGTYEELEEYDTSKLKENDIIKVLSDETIGGATAYYRWVNGAWQYIGQEGPYYTKSQTDALLDQKMDITSLDNYYTKTETNTLLAAKASVSDLANKQDTLVAGSNITIDPTTNVISAIVPSLTNYYTKSETYNTTEVDNLISGVEANIPTKTSDLLNDSGFLTSIPIASSSVLGGIKVGSGLSIGQDGTLSATGTSITIDSALSTTSTNPVENRVITNALNNKANISDIPTVPTNISAFYNDVGYLTSTDVASNYYNKSETYTQAQVNALIPTKTSDLTNDGANGTSTYVEASSLATVATSGSYNDLTNKPTIMSGLVEMSYGESDAWAKFIAAYQAKQIVYCRASSNSNPASGSQTRKAFMAYVNNAENPTEVEFQYVRSVSSKTSSQPVDQVFVYKLTSASGGTWTVQTRDMGPKLAQGTNTTVSYSNGTYTISATQPTVNNATLTIQQNGTNVQTFTANQATNATANITVPTKTSDLVNDSNFVASGDLATVATSGSYNDLSDKPTIPAAQIQSDWTQATTTAVDYIKNKPTLATVATSGSYNDLSDKPTIPTVNNATLTIQQNGTNVQTFTANQSTNATANIIVPTKTSDLTNDSNFVSDASYVHTDNNYTTADKNKLAGIAAGAEVNVQADWDESNSSSDAYIQNKPTIGNATLTVQKNGATLDTFTANATTNKTINIPVPTKTSDLTNDSGYVVDDGDITCTGTEGGFAQITNPTSHNVAPLSLTHLYGNATQKTLSGKNLLDDTTVQQTIPSSGAISISVPMTIAEGTYSFGAFADGIFCSESNYYVFQFRNGQTSIKGSSVPTQPITLTAQEASQVDNVLCYFNSSFTTIYKNKKLTAMICSGSTLGNYEPYVGGVASPNPSYPQAVNVVSGAQEVKIMGKNLVETPDATVPQTAGMTTAWSNNVAHITGTNTSTSFPISNMIYLPTKLKKGTKITMSVGENAPYFTTFRFYSPEEGWWGAGIPSGSKSATATLEISPDRVQFYSGSVPVNTAKDYTISNFMLEIGEEATNFEPYQGQSQEINLGKNLININSLATATITVTNGVATGQAQHFYAAYGQSTDGVPFIKKKGQLAISFKAYTDGNESTTNTNGLVVRVVYTDGTSAIPIYCKNNETTAVQHTAITASDKDVANIQLTYSNYSSNIWHISEFQIEQGQPTPYAPYKTPIELAGVGEIQPDGLPKYRDCFRNIDGTWYIHKELGKQTFTGSEEWYLFGNNSGFFLAVSDALAPISPTTTDTKLIMSDNYSACLFNDIYTSAVNYGVSLYGATNPINRICFRNKDCATANDFKTWLSTHNTTVYYALATPTETEITDSELVGQLDAILDASLYVGQNNIFLIPSGGAQGEMTLCASLSQLPVATTQRLGAVMVGDGLTIAENGALSTVGDTYTINVVPGSGSTFSPFEGQFFDDPDTNLYYTATRYISDGYSNDFTVSDSTGKIVPFEDLFSAKDTFLKSTFKFIATCTQFGDQINVNIEASPSNITVAEGYENDHIMVCGSFSIDEIPISESTTIAIIAPLRWSLTIFSDGRGVFMAEGIDETRPA